MSFKEVQQYFRNLKNQPSCDECPFRSTCPDGYPICDSVIDANPVEKPEPKDPRQLNLFNQ